MMYIFFTDLAPLYLSLQSDLILPHKPKFAPRLVNPIPKFPLQTMSSSEAQAAYNQAIFIEPMEAQEGFAQQFDLSQPDKAMSSYQKLVHSQ